MKPIPSPKSLPVFGTALSIMAAGGASKLHLYVDRRHRELGPIYREKIGPVSGVFVSDGNYARKIFGAEGKYPKHIVPESWLLYNQVYRCKRGLLFMDDEEWLGFRKTMNELLLKVDREEFYAPVSLVADNFVENCAKNEKLINLEKSLYKWSLQVIIAVLLGCESYAANLRRMEPAIERLSESVHRVFVETANISFVPAKIACGLRLPAWRRFVLAAGTAIEQGNRITEQVLEAEERRPGTDNLISKMARTGMDPEDLKRIVTDLILAAGDTTVHTTQWLLHLLSMNPRVQSLIYEEMVRRPEEDFRGSPLLKGALREALRLYPVAPFITRFLPEDLVLDDYRIEAKVRQGSKNRPVGKLKDELVLLSQYSSGRNEKYFPRAESFLPQRWSKGGKGCMGVTNSAASLPFAMGARSCVGRKIAETQILVTVSKILHKYIIKTANTKMIDMTLHLISVPSEAVHITLEERKNKAEPDFA